MDRQEALDTALGQIERQFGKGSVMRMSDRAAVSVGAVSTGSLSLDLALGIGGLPRGRIIEIFGPESSGKTTLVYHVIAEAQRRGGICAFIDAEHSMDPTYAKHIGVNIDELLVSQPDTGEQALEITELLIRSGAVDVVAVDSVAALTPKAEIEGEMGDSHMGLQARLMSQALRKLAGTLNRTDTICIFTNQLREKIGVMFGNPETTPGGRALKFYASVRLDIRRIETLKEGVEAFGNRVRVKVVKNKVAPPFKQAEFDIIYGSGISWEGSVLDTGLERKVVQKSGSYFSFADERLGQGRQNATAFLREHPDVCQQILARIQAEVGADQVVSARLLPSVVDRARRRDGRRAGGRGDAGQAEPDAPRRSTPPPRRHAWSRSPRSARAARAASRSSWTERPGGCCPWTWRSASGSRWESGSTGARLRALRRELRRHEALAPAAGALRHRDLSRRALDARLARRSVAPLERADALQVLERAGIVDDARFGETRARATRGAGMGRRGDSGRPRAAGGSRRADRPRARGSRAGGGAGAGARSCGAAGGVATARWLARKGFGDDAIEAAAGPGIADDP